jgi:hypothetical protein
MPDAAAPQNPPPAIAEGTATTAVTSMAPEQPVSGSQNEPAASALPSVAAKPDDMVEMVKPVGLTEVKPQGSGVDRITSSVLTLMVSFGLNYLLKF